MADVPDEAAGQSQVHGCSSYPLSFPSQPPDIRNWFSSYEYESPEALELVADPGGDNGSETQDPLEYRVPGHSVLNQTPRDGYNASRGNTFGSQSEHEVSAIRDLVPTGRSTVEHGVKRKQSLRELFGAGFLDDRDEATETASRVVLVVQRNAVEPLSSCNAVDLPEIKRSHEGAIERSELPADCDSISLADTQENPPGGQETEHCRLPVNLAGIEVSFLEDDIEHSKLPVDFHKKIPADTEKNDIEHRILPVNCDGIGSAVTEESSPRDEIGRGDPTLEHQETEGTFAADGFVAIKTKGEPAEECRRNKVPKPSMGRERTTLQENRSILRSKGREKATVQENHSILEQNVLVQDRTRSPLADITNLSELAGAPTPELCGKWKCPRKGKPYVGPRLKQLRLEQWVRRVN